MAQGLEHEVHPSVRGGLAVECSGPVREADIWCLILTLIFLSKISIFEDQKGCTWWLGNCIWLASVSQRSLDKDAKAMFGQTALGTTSTGQLGLVLEVITDRYLGPRQSSGCHW